MASDGVPLEELLGNDVEPEHDVELRRIDCASGIACIDRIGCRDGDGSIDAGCRKLLLVIIDLAVREVGCGSLAHIGQGRVRSALSIGGKCGPEALLADEDMVEGNA